MLPTPSTSHVNYDNIYEPAEDSFLLLDTLSAPSEVEFLRNRFPQSSPAPLIVELGTGSGVVLAFVTAQAREIFGRHDVASVGVDLNPLACKATAETAAVALLDVKGTSFGSSPFFLDSVTGDLATPFKAGSIDVLIFNPPYVPTEALPSQSAIDERAEISTLSSSARFERDSYLLSLSYAGGIDGMETTNRLLFEQMQGVLSVRGVAYILLCAQNKPDEVAERIRSWQGAWSVEKVRTSGKTAGWERLCVLRIWRKHET